VRVPASPRRFPARACGSRLAARSAARSVRRWLAWLRRLTVTADIAERASQVRPRPAGLRDSRDPLLDMLYLSVTEGEARG
jgi:hypothetical protein